MAMRCARLNRSVVGTAGWHPAIWHWVLVLTVLTGRTANAQPRLALDERERRAIPFVFSEIIGLRELGNGSVLVADRKDRTLYLVEAIGSTTPPQTKPVGRAGSGPMEYGAVGPLFAGASDTTFMYDLRNRRWVVLVGGEIRRTMTDTDFGIAETGGGTAVRGRDAEGRLLLVRSRPFAEAPSSAGVPDSLMLLLASERGRRVDTVASLASLGDRAIIGQRAADGTPTRFALVSPTVVSEDQAVLFDDGWVAVATQAPYRVCWIAPDGRRVNGPELPHKRTTYDAGERQAYAAHLDRLGRRKPSTADASRWPKTIPAFSANGLLATPDHRLVVRQMVRAGATGTRYLFIDRSGKAVGQMDLPESQAIAGFGPGSVYVVQHGSAGEQQLVRYAWTGGR